MVAITNAEIITYLSTGYTLKGIEKETGISVRTLQSRLNLIRKRTFSKTTPHLVATYLRKNLIE